MLDGSVGKKPRNCSDWWQMPPAASAAASSSTAASTTTKTTTRRELRRRCKLPSRTGQSAERPPQIRAQRKNLPEVRRFLFLRQTQPARPVRTMAADAQPVGRRPLQLRF